MHTLIQTAGHAYQRAPSGVYTIRNLETGRTTRVAGADAMLLDIDLSGCSLRAIDGILAQYEVVS